MSYQLTREDTIVKLARIGLRTHQIRSLFKLANTLRRLSEAQCNGTYPAGNRPEHTDGKECPDCERKWRPRAFRGPWCPMCYTQRMGADLIHSEAGYLTGTWTLQFSGLPGGNTITLQRRDSTGTTEIGILSR